MTFHDLFSLEEAAFDNTNAPPNYAYSVIELYDSIIENVSRLKKHQHVWIADFTMDAAEPESSVCPTPADLVKIRLASFDYWVEHTASLKLPPQSIAV